MKKMLENFKRKTKRALGLILALNFILLLLPIIPAQAEYESTPLSFDIIPENDFPTLDEWLPNTYESESFAPMSSPIASPTASYVGPTSGEFIAPIETTDYTGWTAISNRAGLEAMASNLSGKYYLTADINLSGAEWIPIGNDGNTPFTGTLDGRGYVIKNLTITGAGHQYNGLFGYIRDATVKNVGMENTRIDVTRSDSNIVCAGSICGESYGTILINNCYNMGDISAVSTSYSYAGGICGFGELHVSINSCYNVGNISSFASDSPPSSDSYVGGICGYYNVFTSVMIANCYWNSDSIQTVNNSPQSPKRGIGNGDDTTTPLTPTQMTNRTDYATNYIGFDFNNTWGFVDGTNENYPILRAFSRLFRALN